MIKTYKIKETFQALLWTGKNKGELEDFVGEEKLEWTLSTIKPPIPEIVKNNLTQNKKIEIGVYIVKINDNFEIMDVDDFQKKYEEI
jgi:hypothetical protein